MTSFINRFKIPTILGLGVILAGIAGGVFLTLQNQSFSLVGKAAPDLSPQNVTITNVTEDSLTISWQTTNPAVGFVTFGQITPTEQTATDDRDPDSPKPHITHHITLKKLTPQTTYQLKIISGKTAYGQILKASTAPANSVNGELKPVIGSVISVNQAVDDAIVYLSVSGAVTQSAVVKNLGNFIIPLAKMRTSEGNLGKLTVISSLGKATALIKLGEDKTIGPLKIGQDLDLTVQTASLSSKSQVSKFDLNGDGRVNAADYAIVVQNLGKKGQGIKGDLDGNGIVDQKDLELMLQTIKNQGK